MRLIGWLLIGLTVSVAMAQTDHKTPGAPVPKQRAAQAKVSPVLMLRARVGPIAFDEAPLSDVFEALGRMTGIQFVVQWAHLEEFGIERDQPVTVHARNLRLSQVLWLILNHGDLADAKLAYRADNDAITITTELQLGRDLFVRVYDVSDLLVTRLARPGVAFGRQTQSVIGNNVAVAEGAVASTPIIGTFNSGVTFETDDIGGTIGGGFGDLFGQALGGNSNGGNTNEDDDTTAQTERLMRQLINLITTTVEPDSWDINGGRGTVQRWRNLLVVRNSALVHQKLGGPIRTSGKP